MRKRKVLPDDFEYVSDDEGDDDDGEYRDDEDDTRKKRQRTTPSTTSRVATTPKVPATGPTTGATSMSPTSPSMAMLQQAGMLRSFPPQGVMTSGRFFFLFVKYKT